MTTLRQVKDVQPGWFSLKNKRFFGDKSYKVLHGKASRKPFLISVTYGWSDMFGETPRLHYRIHALKDDLKMGGLFDKAFSTIDDVKDYLKLQ